MAIKIKMVSIPVNDPVAAFKYYTTILGFKEHMLDAEAQLAIVVSESEPKGTMLLLEPASGSEISKTFQTQLRAAKIPVMTFSVDNLKEEYVRLINLDVPFLKKPTEQSWGKEAIIDDGQGNYVQLIEENSLNF